jgi:hypothetical protein
MTRRDPVTSAVRSTVLRRDGRCFMHRLDDTHVCRDRWGAPHSPYALDLLTLDHVKDHPRMGVRAPSDAGHLVAMCWAANDAVPSKEVRAAERAYLAQVGWTEGEMREAWGR